MAEKRKVEELQQSTEVKRAKHSLLGAQISGADSSLFSLDDRSHTAIATHFYLFDNLDILDDFTLTETNFDILNDLAFADTNFDILDDLAWRETNFDILDDFVVLPDFDSDFDIFSSPAHTDVFTESNTCNGELILEEIENISQLLAGLSINVC